jgi:colicin import membrane protein
VDKSAAEATAAEKKTAEQIAGLTPIVASLETAATKAQDAASKSPGDKELADAVTKLRAVAEEKKAQFAAAQKTHEAQKAAVAKVNQDLAAAKKLAAEAATALAAASERLAKADAASKAADPKAAAAKKSADEAAAAFAAAEKQLTAIRGEIALAKGLAPAGTGS